MSTAASTVTVAAFGAAETLLLAAATLGVAAAALTGFGLRRARPRGWGAWIAAAWLATGGALLAALVPEPPAEALAGVLLMQWPVVTLIGLRAFQARDALPGRSGRDLALLGAASTLVLAPVAANPALAEGVAGAASLVLHLYAAAVLLRGPGGREGAPLQALAATIALTAFAPMFVAMGGGDPASPLTARAVAAALGGIAMAFVTLLLVVERSERQLRDSRRRLRALANLDALTQVPNRRHFHDLASLALATDPPGSNVLLTFDIDHFKRINDELGHAAGDRALTVVSGSVIEQLRSHDVAGRQGGDEFVLLLRRTDTEAAMRVAGRIAVQVQRRSLEADLPRLSLSFGMVQVRPGELVDEALRRADRAMYEAKRAGRGCAVTAAGDEAHPVFSESQRLGLTPV